MSAPIANSLTPPRISGASSDGGRRQSSAPRSLLMPHPLEEDEEPVVLTAPPGVYQSDVQMYVEIDRMVVTLFRRFELVPLV